jgi:hypothetical protein
MKNFGVRDDIKIHNLNGKIKSIHYDVLEYFNNSLRICATSSHTFNSNQLIVNEKINNGRSVIIRDAIMSPTSKIAGWRIYNERYNLISVTNFQLNKYNKVRNVFIDNKLVEVYSFDEFGNIIQVYYPSTNAKDIFKYNFKYVVTQVSIPGTPLIKIGSQNKLIHHFINDIRGNVTKLTTSDFITNNILNTEYYIYNTKGDIIYQYSLNLLQLDYTEKNYEYIYDDKNNWIEKVEYINKKTVKKSLRKITYLTVENYNK